MGVVFHENGGEISLSTMMHGDRRISPEDERWSVTVFIKLGLRRREERRFRTREREVAASSDDAEIRNRSSK
jgi:hypothetical protein